MRRASYLADVIAGASIGILVGWPAVIAVGLALVVVGELLWWARRD